MTEANGYDQTANRVAPQLRVGLAAMLLGLLLVLENFGVVEARRLVRYWPLLLIGLGLVRLLKSLRSGAGPSGHVLLAIGTGLLLVNLGLVRVSQVLAVLLLATGAVMAWRAYNAPRRAPELALEPGQRLALSSLMSYVSRSNSSPDFRGGQTSAVAGYCEIDLRGARIQGGEAVLEIFAFWGGIEIKVPADWVVEARGTAVLGAFEDSSRRPADDHQKLIVAGMVIMGGVEIRN